MTSLYCICQSKGMLNSKETENNWVLTFEKLQPSLREDFPLRKDDENVHQKCVPVAKRSHEDHGGLTVPPMMTFAFVEFALRTRHLTPVFQPHRIVRFHREERLKLTPLYDSAPWQGLCRC